LIFKARRATQSLVDANWSAIEHVAQALFARQSPTREELKDLIRNSIMESAARRR
jgi:hypothetical protein